MRPLIYSKRKAANEKIGWHRGCEQINYKENEIKRKAFMNYSTLSFIYNFEYSNDLVFFAYSIPYSFSDLNKFINSIIQDPARANFVNKKILCKTNGGNNCEYLIITSKIKHKNEISNPHMQEKKIKKLICLTARVHPGETVSSWVMQGFSN